MIGTTDTATGVRSVSCFVAPVDPRHGGLRWRSRTSRRNLTNVTFRRSRRLPAWVNSPVRILTRVPRPNLRRDAIRTRREGTS